MPIYERQDVVDTRDRVCSSVHGANYSLGTRTEGRVKTTVTTRWPSVLNRADDVTVAHTPWRVDPGQCLQVRQRHGGVATVGSQPPPCHDACHGLFTHEESETKEESCGTGYTGTQTFRRTREYVLREYAAPLPFLADVRVREEPWLNTWMKTGDTCRRQSNNGCGGGPQCQPGYTGNNNNNGGNPPVRPRSPHKGITRNNPINVGTSTHPGVNP